MPNRLARRLSRGITVVALLLAAYYAVFAGEYDRFDVRDLREQEQAQIGRVDSLEAVLDSVTSWADSLETDSAVIERVARERHRFIRPGERLYVFVDDTRAGAETRP